MSQISKQDKKRYQGSGMRMPLFQFFFRAYQEAHNPVSRILFKGLYIIFRYPNHIEISSNARIGAGLYIGHPYGIAINKNAILGENINIHKGVVIGQTNRGERKGTPIIGNDVWIGINSVIVGKVTIGDDVLIAPNSYVNCDVPSHSVVLGNPCIIKHKEHATEGYIDYPI